MFPSGLEAGNQPPPKQTQSSVAVSNSEVPQQHGAGDSQNQGHWGENRLADVVKGTAKSKSSGTSATTTATKESGTVTDNDSPRAVSPHQPPPPPPQQQPPVQSTRHPEVLECKDAATGNDDAIQTGAVTLTPPSSPDK